MKKRAKEVKILLLIMLMSCFFFVTKVGFAAPPPTPTAPVPLAGEEFLIPTLVGYGLYRLRKKNNK